MFRAEFSPGPWVASVDREFSGSGLLPVRVAVYAPHENDQVPIAALPLEGRSRAEVEANAALIAAAPAILAALQAALAGDNQWREKAAAALNSSRPLCR